MSDTNHPHYPFEILTSGRQRENTMDIAQLQRLTEVEFSKLQAEITRLTAERDRLLADASVMASAAADKSGVLQKYWGVLSDNAVRAMKIGRLQAELAAAKKQIEVMLSANRELARGEQTAEPVSEAGEQTAEPVSEAGEQVDTSTLHVKAVIHCLALELPEEVFVSAAPVLRATLAERDQLGTAVVLALDCEKRTNKIACAYRQGLGRIARLLGIVDEGSIKGLLLMPLVEATAGSICAELTSLRPRLAAAAKTEKGSE